MSTMPVKRMHYKLKIILVAVLEGDKVKNLRGPSLSIKICFLFLKVSFYKGGICIRNNAIPPGTLSGTKCLEIFLIIKYNRLN